MVDRLHIREGDELTVMETDEGLLESALARPRNRWEYGDDPDLAELAASYARGIVQNHPFVDGNERTPLMAAYTFLAINGRDLDAPEPETVSVMTALSGGELSENELAEWVRRHTKPSQDWAVRFTGSSPTCLLRFTSIDMFGRLVRDRPREAQMRWFPATLALALLASGCDAPSTATLSESRSAAIEDSVAAFLSTWSEESEQDAWDRMAERYADDPRFLWVEDGRVRYRSVKEIRAGFEGLEESFSGARTDFTGPAITALAPGLAHVVTRFTTTLTRADGSDVRFGGAMTMTVLHTDAGWKVLRGHMSSERDRRRGTEPAQPEAR